MSKLNELAVLGQSVWYDYIRRGFIRGGELQSLVNMGLRGITSNPTIFEKAIAGTDEYDGAIRELLETNVPVDVIHESLIIDDIRAAAGLMRPVYDASKGLDGYVSIELSPKLAHDTEGSIREAKRLFHVLNMPNIMVKIPATQEGLPAISESISSGVNINITLIFGVENYRQVAEAYMKGLEKLYEKGGNLHSVSSVASIFVSRLDTAVDKLLDRIVTGSPDSALRESALRLKGKIALANANEAYSVFRSIFVSERWRRLVRNGARVQRILWASTGTKNPDYPDTLYVDSLIGEATVTTIPPATFQAFLDHGTVKSVLGTGSEVAMQELAALKNLGIDVDAITDDLQVQGLEAFATDFEKLIMAVKQKSDVLSVH
jgi:transaldolase